MPYWPSLHFQDESLCTYRSVEAVLLILCYFMLQISCFTADRRPQTCAEDFQAKILKLWWSRGAEEDFEGEIGQLKIWNTSFCDEISSPAPLKEKKVVWVPAFIYLFLSAVRSISSGPAWSSIWLVQRSREAAEETWKTSVLICLMPSWTSS